MSNLELAPEETQGGGAIAIATAAADVLVGREVPLGRHTVVRRFLPHRERRMVGAWCFVDHYGPEDITRGPGMQVPPHPHTGLQTVSWLLDGEILHRDSLGSLQPVRPGQLNLMTSGHGIAHSEESPPERPPQLHGLQLWIALPDQDRAGPARFEHHADLPVLQDGPLTVTVIVGELAGARSPAQVHNPLFGADVAVDAGTDTRIPLEPEFEYAALVVTGAASLDGATGTREALVYLGRGRSDLSVRASEPSRLFLFGGKPFEEQLVMWWNFIGRSHEDIVQAREDWMSGSGRFGEVHGYAGDPLPAPPLPGTRLRARGREG